MTAAYLEDTERIGLGRPDFEPKATEMVPEIVALIEALVDRGQPTRPTATCTSACAHCRSTARSRTATSRTWTRARASRAPAQGGPARLRALEGHQAEEDTAWDSPWGRGRPGWHIECSAMAETAARRAVRDPRRRQRPDLPAPRERGGADARRARARARGDLDAQRDAQMGDEKMAKSVGNVARSATCSTRRAVTR